jgi:hypothetical protein
MIGGWWLVFGGSKKQEQMVSHPYFSSHQTPATNRQNLAQAIALNPFT